MSSEFTALGIPSEFLLVAKPTSDRYASRDAIYRREFAHHFESERSGKTMPFIGYWRALCLYGSEAELRAQTQTVHAGLEKYFKSYPVIAQQFRSKAKSLGITSPEGGSLRVIVYVPRYVLPAKCPSLSKKASRREGLQALKDHPQPPHWHKHCPLLKHASIQVSTQPWAPASADEYYVDDVPTFSQVTELPQNNQPTLNDMKKHLQTSLLPATPNGKGTAAPKTPATPPQVPAGTPGLPNKVPPNLPRSLADWLVREKVLLAGITEVMSGPLPSALSAAAAAAPELADAPDFVASIAAVADIKEGVADSRKRLAEAETKIGTETPTAPRTSLLQKMERAASVAREGSRTSPGNTPENPFIVPDTSAAERHLFPETPSRRIAYPRTSAVSNKLALATHFARLDPLPKRKVVLVPFHQDGVRATLLHYRGYVIMLPTTIAKFLANFIDDKIGNAQDWVKAMGLPQALAALGTEWKTTIAETKEDDSRLDIEYRNMKGLIEQHDAIKNNLNSNCRYLAAAATILEGRPLWANFPLPMATIAERAESLTEEEVSSYFDEEDAAEDSVAPPNLFDEAQE